MKQEFAKPSAKEFLRAYFKNLIFAVVAYLIVWWLVVGFEKNIMLYGLVFGCSAILYALIKTHFDLILAPKLFRNRTTNK